MSFGLPKSAVCVFAFDSFGKILSVTRRNTDIWSLPGGKVDPGETLEAALYRETLEETGFALMRRPFVPIYSEVVVGDDRRDYYCTAFWYPEVIDTPTEYDGMTWNLEEGITVSFITIDELLTGAFADFNRRALDNLGRFPINKKGFCLDRNKR